MLHLRPSHSILLCILLCIPVQIQCYKISDKELQRWVEPNTHWWQEHQAYSNQNGCHQIQPLGHPGTSHQYVEFNPKYSKEITLIGHGNEIFEIINTLKTKNQKKDVMIKCILHNNNQYTFLESFEADSYVLQSLLKKYPNFSHLNDNHVHEYNNVIPCHHEAVIMLPSSADYFNLKHQTEEAATKQLRIYDNVMDPCNNIPKFYEMHLPREDDYVVKPINVRVGSAMKNVNQHNICVNGNVISNSESTAMISQKNEFSYIPQKIQPNIIDCNLSGLNSFHRSYNTYDISTPIIGTKYSNVYSDNNQYNFGPKNDPKIKWYSHNSEPIHYNASPITIPLLFDNKNPYVKTQATGLSNKGYNIKNNYEISEPINNYVGTNNYDVNADSNQFNVEPKYNQQSICYSHNSGPIHYNASPTTIPLLFDNKNPYITAKTPDTFNAYNNIRDNFKISEPFNNLMGAKHSNVYANSNQFNVEPNYNQKPICYSHNSELIHYNASPITIPLLSDNKNPYVKAQAAGPSNIGYNIKNNYDISEPINNYVGTNNYNINADNNLFNVERKYDPKLKCYSYNSGPIYYNASPITIPLLFNNKNPYVKAEATAPSNGIYNIKNNFEISEPPNNFIGTKHVNVYANSNQFNVEPNYNQEAICYSHNSGPIHYNASPTTIPLLFDNKNPYITAKTTDTSNAYNNIRDNFKISEPFNNLMGTKHFNVYANSNQFNVEPNYNQEAICYSHNSGPIHYNASPTTIPLLFDNKNPYVKAQAKGPSNKGYNIKNNYEISEPINNYMETNNLNVYANSNQFNDEPKYNQKPICYSHNSGPIHYNASPITIPLLFDNKNPYVKTQATGPSNKGYNIKNNYEISEPINNYMGTKNLNVYDNRNQFNDEPKYNQKAICYSHNSGPIHYNASPTTIPLLFDNKNPYITPKTPDTSNAYNNIRDNFKISEPFANFIGTKHINVFANNNQLNVQPKTNAKMKYYSYNSGPIHYNASSVTIPLLFDNKNSYVKAQATGPSNKGYNIKNNFEISEPFNNLMGAKHSNVYANSNQFNVEPNYNQKAICSSHNSGPIHYNASPTTIPLLFDNKNPYITARTPDTFNAYNNIRDNFKINEPFSNLMGTKYSNVYANRNQFNDEPKYNQKAICYSHNSGPIHYNASPITIPFLFDNKNPYITAKTPDTSNAYNSIRDNFKISEPFANFIGTKHVNVFANNNELNVQPKTNAKMKYYNYNSGPIHYNASPVTIPLLFDNKNPYVKAQATGPSKKGYYIKNNNYEIREPINNYVGTNNYDINADSNQFNVEPKYNQKAIGYSHNSGPIHYNASPITIPFLFENKNPYVTAKTPDTSNAYNSIRDNFKISEPFANFIGTKHVNVFDNNNQLNVQPKTNAKVKYYSYNSGPIHYNASPVTIPLLFDNKNPYVKAQATGPSNKYYNIKNNYEISEPLNNFIGTKHVNVYANSNQFNDGPKYDPKIKCYSYNSEPIQYKASPITIPYLFNNKNLYENSRAPDTSYADNKMKSIPSTSKPLMSNYKVMRPLTNSIWQPSYKSPFYQSSVSNRNKNDGISLQTGPISTLNMFSNSNNKPITETVAPPVSLQNEFPFVSNPQFSNIKLEQNNRPSTFIPKTIPNDFLSPDFTQQTTFTTPKKFSFSSSPLSYSYSAPTFNWSSNKYVTPTPRLISNTKLIDPLTDRKLPKTVTRPNLSTPFNKFTISSSPYIYSSPSSSWYSAKNVDLQKDLIPNPGFGFNSKIAKTISPSLTEIPNTTPSFSFNNNPVIPSAKDYSSRPTVGGIPSYFTPSSNVVYSAPSNSWIPPKYVKPTKTLNICPFAPVTIAKALPSFNIENISPIPKYIPNSYALNTAFGSPHPFSMPSSPWYTNVNQIKPTNSKPYFDSSNKIQNIYAPPTMPINNLENKYIGSTKASPSYPQFDPNTTIYNTINTPVMPSNILNNRPTPFSTLSDFRVKSSPSYTNISPSSYWDSPKFVNPMETPASNFNLDPSSKMYNAIPTPVTQKHFLEKDRTTFRTSNQFTVSSSSSIAYSAPSYYSYPNQYAGPTKTTEFGPSTKIYNPMPPVMPKYFPGNYPTTFKGSGKFTVGSLPTYSATPFNSYPTQYPSPTKTSLSNLEFVPRTKLNNAFATPVTPNFVEKGSTTFRTSSKKNALAWPSYTYPTPSNYYNPNNYASPTKTSTSYDTKFEPTSKMFNTIASTPINKPKAESLTKVPNNSERTAFVNPRQFRISSSPRVAYYPSSVYWSPPKYEPTKTFTPNPNFGSNTPVFNNITPNSKIPITPNSYSFQNKITPDNFLDPYSKSTGTHFTPPPSWYPKFDSNRVLGPNQTKSYPKTFSINNPPSIAITKTTPSFSTYSNPVIPKNLDTYSSTGYNIPRKFTVSSLPGYTYSSPSSFWYSPKIFKPTPNINFNEPAFPNHYKKLPENYQVSQNFNDNQNDFKNKPTSQIDNNLDTSGNKNPSLHMNIDFTSSAIHYTTSTSSVGSPYKYEPSELKSPSLFRSPTYPVNSYNRNFWNPTKTYFTRQKTYYDQLPSEKYLGNYGTEENEPKYNQPNIDHGFPYIYNSDPFGNSPQILNQVGLPNRVKIPKNVFEPPKVNFLTSEDLLTTQLSTTPANLYNNLLYRKPNAKPFSTFPPNLDFSSKNSLSTSGLPFYFNIKTPNQQAQNLVKENLAQNRYNFNSNQQKTPFRPDYKISKDIFNKNVIPSRITTYPGSIGYLNSQVPYYDNNLSTQLNAYKTPKLISDPRYNNLEPVSKYEPSGNIYDTLKKESYDPNNNDNNVGYSKINYWKHKNTPTNRVNGESRDLINNKLLNAPGLRYYNNDYKPEYSTQRNLNFVYGKANYGTAKFLTPQSYYKAPPDLSYRMNQSPIPELNSLGITSSLMPQASSEKNIMDNNYYNNDFLGVRPKQYTCMKPKKEFNQDKNVPNIPYYYNNKLYSGIPLQYAKTNNFVATTSIPTPNYSSFDDPSTFDSSYAQSVPNVNNAKVNNPYVPQKSQQMTPSHKYHISPGQVSWSTGKVHLSDYPVVNKLLNYGPYDPYRYGTENKATLSYNNGNRYYSPSYQNTAFNNIPSYKSSAQSYLPNININRPIYKNNIQAKDAISNEPLYKPKGGVLNPYFDKEINKLLIKNIKPSHAYVNLQPGKISYANSLPSYSIIVGKGVEGQKTDPSTYTYDRTSSYTPQGNFKINDNNQVIFKYKSHPGNLYMRPAVIQFTRTKASNVPIYNNNIGTNHLSDQIENSNINSNFYSNELQDNTPYFGSLETVGLESTKYKPSGQISMNEMILKPNNVGMQDILSSYPSFKVTDFGDVKYQPSGAKLMNDIITKYDSNEMQNIGSGYPALKTDGFTSINYQPLDVITKKITAESNNNVNQDSKSYFASLAPDGFTKYQPSGQMQMSKIHAYLNNNGLQDISSSYPSSTRIQSNRIITSSNDGMASYFNPYWKSDISEFTKDQTSGKMNEINSKLNNKVLQGTTSYNPYVYGNSPISTNGRGFLNTFPRQILSYPSIFNTITESYNNYKLSEKSREPINSFQAAKKFYSRISSNLASQANPNYYQNNQNLARFPNILSTGKYSLASPAQSLSKNQPFTNAFNRNAGISKTPQLSVITNPGQMTYTNPYYYSSNMKTDNLPYKVPCNVNKHYNTNLNKVIAEEITKKLNEKIFSHLHNLYTPVEIDLGSIGIVQYVPNACEKPFTIKTNDPNIEMMAWKSKIRVLKPRIVIDTEDVYVTHFVPIVKCIYNNDYNNVHDTVKKIVTDNYGKPMTVKHLMNCDPYCAVFCDENSIDLMNDNLNLLWPTVDGNYCRNAHGSYLF